MDVAPNSASTFHCVLIRAPMENALYIAQQFGKDILLAVFGIVGGGVISLFFYRKSLLRSEISYACEYTRLIWSRIPAFSRITLSRDGKQLRDPRRVLFYVWNSGNVTIDGDRITEADPLQLRAGEVTIISADIVKNTREVNRTRAGISKTGDVHLRFDYLDPGDGFVIEALYDIDPNNKPSNTCPELLGTIKGIAGPPVAREIAFESRTLARVANSTALLLSLLGTIILFVFQTYEIAAEHSWVLLVPKLLTAFVLLAVALAMIGGLVFALRSRRIPKVLKVTDDAEDFVLTYSALVEKIEVGNQKIAAETKLIEHDYPETKRKTR